MHMCREVNLASSSSWMYIAYKFLSIDYPSLISLFLTKRGRKFVWWFELWTLCWWLTKRGRSIWVICMISLRERKILRWFWDFDLCFYSCITRNKRFVLFYMHSFAYIFMCFIEYLLLIYYAWVKGELLWSFTLIHAYITPWVLSSSKRGRLLAQRPFTLVLMMINSCSYSY